MYSGKERVFAPDVFFIFGGRAYLMEVQIKRMSRTEWSKKWQRWNEYFGGGYYLQASWQRFKKGGGLIPNVLVNSLQEKDIVAEGFRVPGRTVETIEVSMLTTVLTKHNPLQVIKIINGRKRCEIRIIKGLEEVREHSSFHSIKHRGRAILAG
ncbi:hypothetical protein PM3016_5411 [Paenibacillus mucilaginosus 3016]|uniref:Uncharacterized protein n=2 Tax=Paenibacillus mucilaginosus TaxID=61624 RepID=H6NDR2_9BACL|nr:hypothetical protein PM3016_5411 [Paenibacillus mucilaginosus 3016]